MKTPSNLTLNKAKNQLTITFDDIDYALSAQYLRTHSPSAEVQGHAPGQETLQIGKENVTIQKLDIVGNYAVQPTFSDNHDTGIFSWETLYNLAINQETLWADYLAKLEANENNNGNSKITEIK